MPVRPEVTNGTCPFCHRAFTVDWGELGEDGQLKPNTGVLLHALPVCSDFARLSADEFVAAVLAGKHRS